MRDEGMTATVSSIHVNGWYGAHNKLRRRALDRARAARHADLDAQLDRWAYVGDSTNDVLMFEHFRHSIGVANIRALRGPIGALADVSSPTANAARASRSSRRRSWPQGEFLLPRTEGQETRLPAAEHQVVLRRMCSRQACAKASSVRA